jgi:cysteine-rich repeat protein
LGIFHLKIGSETALSSSDLENTRWLGITINNGEELNPRQQISSAAFALRAEMAEHSAEAINATQLGGLPASDYVLSPDLQDGDDDTLGALTCGVDAVPKWSGSAWYCGSDLSGSSDTTLTEEQVDAMVANNDYSTGAHTTDTTLSDEQVLNIVTGAGHVPGAHTADTMNSLSCAEGEVAQWDGSTWICASGGSKLPVAEPTPCDEAAKGSIYFDDVTHTLRICDGTSYRKVRLCSEVCASAESVACGLAIEDDCSQSCGGGGTGLNLNQCTDPALVPCGNALSDDCENICPGTGTGFDPGECNAAFVACGVPVQDSCGNDCSESGVLCTEPGATCLSGVCAVCGNGVTDPGEGCDDGNLTPGDGCNASCQAEFVAFHTFTSVSRLVYIFKSDSNAALSTYNNFCEDNGLAWFVPKSQNDAQTLINQAYALDSHHTWIITKNNTSSGTFGGYSVTVDGPGGSEFSSSGFSGVRKWASSFCDPDLHGVTKCWDSGHSYDWLVCEQL